MRLVFSRLLAVVAAAIMALPCLLGEAAGASDASPQLAAGLAGADVGLDIRYDLLKDEAAGFKLLEREFARDPRPHVKARYAECLIGGKSWGAPDGQQERGMQLATEALQQGSVHAMRVVGWALLTGGSTPAERGSGMVLLRQAAATLNPNALCTIGDAYFKGVGTPMNRNLAEAWYLQAAYAGKPHRLYELGRAYEADANALGVMKACDLYLEASVRGSGAAERRLRELAEAGHAVAARANNLQILWEAAIGDNHTSKVVRAAAQTLETTAPDDLKALLALGRLYASDNAGYRDFPKAYALLDRAARLGSLDARSDRAHLLAEGLGVKQDQVRALAEWRELEKVGHPGALAYLGFYHYWGALKGAKLPKDPALAFAYSKKAADGGDFFGQNNVAVCYEFGIGTPTDYALAARYYWTLAWRGSPYAKEKVRKLINHVPH